MTAGRLRLEPLASSSAPAEAAEARVRLVPPRPPRLPGPIRRGKRRKEIVLRAAVAADAAACAQVDGRSTTTHVWQLDTRQDGDEVRVSFRQVRLPRELALEARHHPPALRGSSVPRGLCWLVAEEIDVLPDGAAEAGLAKGSTLPADEIEPRTDPSPPWNHTLRRTANTSTLQLSLPSDGVEHAPPSGTSGAVVGYVAAASVPGDPNAFLRTLVVDRKYRRKGIAGRLLIAVERWATAQGADELMADVPARNYPALRLLQKAGFTFCGFNDRCYPDNEVALFFSRRLR